MSEAEQRKAMPGVNRPFLTPAQSRRVREALADGITLKDIATRFGVSASFLRRALRREAVQ